MEWHPHPKQEEALKRIEFEILYGGARGGGKTDAGLVWLTDHINHPRYRALVIRKNADDLSDWVDRSIRFYHGLGAKIAYRPAEVTFPSGATIKTGHLKDDQAYTKYQGQEYQRMLIEEITQIPEEKRYLQLLASCRSTIPDIRPQVFATGNPGGLGHVWVKTRFVDPSPPSTPFIDERTGRSRIYIPATVDDNPTLVENDPGYVNFLEGLKDTDVELWKAWRLGDWTTFAGQFFQEWRMDKHVIAPFVPPTNSILVAGMDWGRTKPFAFYVDVITKETFDETDFYRARTFLEVYGTDKRPAEWADEIKKKLKFFDLKLDDLAWIRGDPAMFSEGNDGSTSIADQFKEEDIRIIEANNDRIAGWEVLHHWLSEAPDGLPYWQVGNNCINLIRTLPTLVHDEYKVEDVDTEGEDHSADALRYMKKHLKWIDAKLGAIDSNKQKTRIITAAKMDNGQQIPISLDKFENLNGQSAFIVHRK